MSLSSLDSAAATSPPPQVDAYRYVADLVRREIRLGLLPPGKALPAERELAHLLGVGRTSVQLALRELEAEGLITKRRGRNGGSFVTGVYEDRDRFREVINQALQERGTIRQAMEYRYLVEPAIAGLAAQHHTPEQVAELRLAHAQLQEAPDDAVFMRTDFVFHVTLAKMTENRFLVLGLEEARQCCHPALTLLPESGSFHETSAAEHHEVLVAVEAGDAKAAEKSMRLHVERSMRSVMNLLSTLESQTQPDVSHDH